MRPGGICRAITKNKDTFHKDSLATEEVWDVPAEYQMKSLRYSRDQ